MIRQDSLGLLLTLLAALPAISCTSGIIDEPLPAATVQTDADYWTPAAGRRLQIQYADYPVDMTVNADIFALDLFETPQETIDQLHAEGKKVICYLNTGAWEEYRPDAQDFPETIIGNDYEGWPGEKWLDISRYEEFAPIMQARFDLAAEKECDGIDADNMQNYEEDTGWNLSADDQRTYNLWLSEQAHRRGMSIGLKNDADQAEQLAAYFDWSLIEDCQVYDFCDMLLPFVEAGKPVFQVEYTDYFSTTSDFCAQAVRHGFSGFLKNRELDAWVSYCP